MENRYLDIYNTLSNYFGTMNWWPIAGSEQTATYQHGFSCKERTREEILEISLGAILTQNTNWKNVVRAIHNLKEHHILNIHRLDTIALDDLAHLIRCSGYYRQKARKIKYFVAFVLQKLHGDLYNLKLYDQNHARDLLLNIWGIGEETADSILLYGYSLNFFVVDAYCKRLFTRLGILQEKQCYRNIQGIFHENLPADAHLYKEYHALIVEMGKAFCRAKPRCATCILKSCCQTATPQMKHPQIKNSRGAAG